MQGRGHSDIGRSKSTHHTCYGLMQKDYLPGKGNYSLFFFKNMRKQSQCIITRLSSSFAGNKQIDTFLISDCFARYKSITFNNIKVTIRKLQYRSTLCSDCKNIRTLHLKSCNYWLRGDIFQFFFEPSWFQIGISLVHCVFRTTAS